MPGRGKTELAQSGAPRHYTKAYSFPAKLLLCRSLRLAPIY
jgi:hypothetical protein